MATPNIVNVSTINGLTAVSAVTTSGVNVVTNNSNSGTVVKLNSLYVSNINGTTAATVVVAVNRGATNYRLAYNMSVPAASSLDLLSKSLYLNEGDALFISASVSNYIEAVVSYEVIS